jgi:hypothetical protein
MDWCVLSLGKGLNVPRPGIRQGAAVTRDVAYGDDANSEMGAASAMGADSGEKEGSEVGNSECLAEPDDDVIDCKIVRGRGEGISVSKFSP